jgi:hypothetical protein
LFFVAVLAMIAIGAAAVARVGVARMGHGERTFFVWRVFFFAGRGSLRAAHYKVGIEDGVFFVVAHPYDRLSRCRERVLAFPWIQLRFILFYEVFCMVRSGFIGDWFLLQVFASRSATHLVLRIHMTLFVATSL